MEIEFQGQLKSPTDLKTYVDFEPADLREQVNRTKAEAIKGFLLRAASHLGIPEYVVRNLSINNSLYPFPPADIPVEPLVAERQAKEIATQALKDKYPKYPGTWRERYGHPPGDGAARRAFRIDEILLISEPEFLSFHHPRDGDLFDPVCDFAEHRLAWIALDKEAVYRVKVDAITGEVLLTAYWGPHE